MQRDLQPLERLINIKTGSCQGWFLLSRALGVFFWTAANIVALFGFAANSTAAEEAPATFAEAVLAPAAAEGLTAPPKLMPSWVLDGTEELKEASANEADGVVNMDIL